MHGVSKLSVKSQRANIVLGSAVGAVSVAVAQLCLVLQTVRLCSTPTWWTKTWWPGCCLLVVCPPLFLIKTTNGTSKIRRTRIGEKFFLKSLKWLESKWLPCGLGKIDLAELIWRPNSWSKYWTWRIKKDFCGPLGRRVGDTAWAYLELLPQQEAMLDPSVAASAVSSHTLALQSANIIWFY